MRKSWSIGVYLLLCAWLGWAQQAISQKTESLNVYLQPYSASVRSGAQDTVLLTLRNSQTEGLTDLRFSLKVEEEDLLEDIQLSPDTLAALAPGATANLQLVVTPRRMLLRKSTNIWITLQTADQQTEMQFLLIINPPEKYWQRIGIFATIGVVLLFAFTFLILNKQQ